MNLSNPLLLLTPRIRVVVYLVLGLAAVVIGILDAFFGDADPAWVTGASRAAIWAAPVIGLTAATHVPSAPDSRALVVPEDNEG